jgi:hypothetical protein
VLNRADQERQTLGDEYLSVEHLLLALSDLVGASHDDLLTRCETSAAATG